MRATTVIHTLHVRESGFEGEGSTSVPPTPDLYQQLLQQIKTGTSGKSAYDIALENGFVGTEIEWLESLKGKDGNDGKDGENGRDGADGQPGKDGENGADGKSAFEIALEHGYTGTEEEWLSQMQPDLSPYVTRVETLKLIDDKAGDLKNEIGNLKNRSHSHDNMSVLDSFTQTDKTSIDSLPQFKQGINDDISELHESVSTVVEQAHWHHNLTVLNGITSAKIAKWDSATEWQLQFQTLQGNVMDYQMQMNHRMDEADETISAVDTAVQQLRDSNQYDHQNLSDEINLLTNRVTNLESELEGIDSILGRIVG